MTWFLIDDVALKQLHRINVVCECAPPGLLLSLGDGRAIEVTWAMLYAAIKAGVCAVNAQGEPVVFTSDIPHIVRKLIQQAQEARDA